MNATKSDQMASPEVTAQIKVISQDHHAEAIEEGPGTRIKIKKTKATRATKETLMTKGQ